METSKVLSLGVLVDLLIKVPTNIHIIFREMTNFALSKNQSHKS